MTQSSKEMMWTELIEEDDDEDKEQTEKENLESRRKRGNRIDGERNREAQLIVFFSFPNLHNQHAFYNKTLSLS